MPLCATTVENISIHRLNQICVEGRESMPGTAFFCESELEQPRKSLRVGFYDPRKPTCVIAARWWQVWTLALPWATGRQMRALIQLQINPATND